MSKDDWFRVACLTEEANEQFEERLKRSRSSRPEYMRLQAQALMEAGAYQRAILLLRRIFDEHPDHLDAWLHESVAECYHQTGQFAEAIQEYRRSIEAMRHRPGLRSNAPLLLARLVCEQSMADLYEECLQFMTEFWDPNPLFPRVELHQFGWTAILLDALGRHEDAKPSARRALGAAAKTRSNATKHRRLGLASETDQPLVRRLERIAGGRLFAATGVDARSLMAKLRSVATRQ